MREGRWKGEEKDERRKSGGQREKGEQGGEKRIEGGKEKEWLSEEQEREREGR